MSEDSKKCSICGNKSWMLTKPKGDTKLYCPKCSGEDSFVEQIALTAEQKAKVIRLCDVVLKYCSQYDEICTNPDHLLAKQLKEELQ